MKFLFALIAIASASTDACDQAQEELADTVAELHTNTTEAWATVGMLEIDCKLNCEGVEDAICDSTQIESGIVINTLSFGVTIFCAILSIFKF